MKKEERRANSREGVYACYWRVEEDKGGYKTVEIVVPDQTQASNKVKLMIVDALLKDLNIPIKIEEHLILDNIK